MTLKDFLVTDMRIEAVRDTFDIVDNRGTTVTHALIDHPRKR